MRKGTRLADRRNEEVGDVGGEVAVAEGAEGA